VDRLDLKGPIVYDMDILYTMSTLYESCNSESSCKYHDNLGGFLKLIADNIKEGTIPVIGNPIQTGVSGKIYDSVKPGRVVKKQVITSVREELFFIVECLIQLYILCEYTEVPKPVPFIYQLRKNKVAPNQIVMTLEMEKISGDLEQLENEDQMIRLFTSLCVVLWKIQTLFQGHFIHGDLHSGNVMYRNDPSEVVIIDFGYSCVRSLPKIQTQEHFYFHTLQDKQYDWWNRRARRCINKSHDMRTFIACLDGYKIPNEIIQTYLQHLKRVTRFFQPKLENLHWYFYDRTIMIVDEIFYPENVFKSIRSGKMVGTPNDTLIVDYWNYIDLSNDPDDVILSTLQRVRANKELMDFIIVYFQKNREMSAKIAEIKRPPSLGSILRKIEAIF